MNINNYLAICAIVKDENDYLPEWLDYHFRLGVQQIYLYDDDSLFSIADTVKKYKFKNVLVMNSIKTTANKVIESFFHFLQNFARLYYWVGFIDIDEFINLKICRDLKKFLKGYEKYGGLGINWQVFGSSGHKEKQKLILPNFKLKLPVDHWQNRHIKPIINTQFVKIQRHGGHNFYFKDGYYSVNENFVKIESEHNNSFSDVSINKICINHYYTRSRKDWDDKMRRGRATCNSGYPEEWFDMIDNESTVFDDSLIKSNMVKV